MSKFPNQFVDEVEIIEGGIGRLGDEAVARLNAKKYSVGLGLTPYFAGAIGIMAAQAHIREFCWDDVDVRHTTLETTRRWLQKDGGRAVFLLLKQVMSRDELLGLRLAGYGWSGEKNDEITTAYRMGYETAGLGLATDFGQVLVSATHARFAEGKKITLETWDRNLRAKGLYDKLGFKVVSMSDPELRPTVYPADALGGVFEDQRVYMEYDMSLLAE